MEFTVFAIILSAFMVLVCIYDATHYRIPNWVNGLVLLVYPVLVIASPYPVDWLSGLAYAALLFVVGLIFHRLRLMGGGDIKLLVVCGLYTGLSITGVNLLFYTAILGGVLTIALLILRVMMPGILSKLGAKRIPAIFTIGGPIPYGLAIAGAFLFLLWTGQLPGLVPA